MVISIGISSQIIVQLLFIFHFRRKKVPVVFFMSVSVEDDIIFGCFFRQKQKNSFRVSHYKECVDSPTISLILRTSKIFLKILTLHLQAKTDDFLGPDQFGFRKGCGRCDAVASLRLDL